MSAHVTEPSSLDSLQQDLPAFSGVETRCAKCGWPQATVAYTPSGICDHIGGSIMNVVGGGINERLHRTCTLCGFMWDEAVLEPM